MLCHTNSNFYAFKARTHLPHKAGPTLLVCFLLFTVANAFEFEYPLHPWEDNPGEPRFHPVKDVREQILEKYDNVERRWKNGPSVIDLDTSSPPISAGPERGPYAERRDFALNLQPGAPPFWGPNGEIHPDRDFPANGNYGGNFCDEGALDDHCVIHQILSFPGDYTISGRGTVPFKRVVECRCVEPGCACPALFSDFVPSFGALSWATLTLEVERGTVEHEASLVSAAVHCRAGSACINARALTGLAEQVQHTRADDVLVQGQCNPPPACSPRSAPGSIPPPIALPTPCPVLT